MQLAIFKLPLVLSWLALMALPHGVKGYSPLSTESPIYCAFMPDGSNKILEKTGKQYREVTAAQVSRDISRRLTAAKGIYTRLSRIGDELHALEDGQTVEFRPQEKRYLKIAADFLGSGHLEDYKEPKTREQRLADLESAKIALREREILIESERAALKDCKEGKRSL